MKDLFSIGEISKYQHIPKQTLIYYDKIGLFSPAYVDPENGYRYYSAAQLDDLDTILIMKKIGLSLKEIKEHMMHHTAKETVKIFREQITKIENEIEELMLIDHRLRHRTRQLEGALQRKEEVDAIQTEYCDALELYAFPIEAPYHAADISIASKKCYTAAMDRSLPIYFESGVIVPLEKVKAGRCTEASYAFVPVDPSVHEENIMLMPSGVYVSAYHVGDYASIGQTYAKILQYCDQHGLVLHSDFYEFCVNDYVTSNDENEFITKIMFALQVE